MSETELSEAFRRWSAYDWELQSFDSWRLVLIADNSLAYHHSIEVIFEGIRFVQCPQAFETPRARPSSPHDIQVAVRLEGNRTATAPTEATAFAWDAEVTSGDRVDCLVVAERVTISEGLWLQHASADE